MLNTIIQNTNEYIEEMPKAQRKKKGQFFTSIETARYMANMFSLAGVGEDVSLLDPGAGTGILACALVERLETLDRVKSIEVVCYETDETVLPVLEKNLTFAAEHTEKSFRFRIINEDYILSQDDDFNGSLLSNKKSPKYDLVIGNPPYLRIPKDHPVSKAMPAVVHGAPNLYFIFAAMSLFNLKPNGQMVYIIPRSWTSGAYFKRFRQYLFEHGTLEWVHLFVSRDKVFKQEQVLQETMIVKVRKTQDTNHTVKITASISGDFDDVSSIKVSRDLIVSGDDLYVFLPTNESEVEVLETIRTLDNTFPSSGIRMRTGIVVDFRQYADLRPEESSDTVPLFYSQHIRNGRVNHEDSGKGLDWIVNTKRGLIQRNKNYVFCKRFTAKEERRRLQCGIYLEKDFPDYDFIATQNKINYVDSVDGSALSEEMVYGIYVLLNSTLYDLYYRILNGSTQVNSTEINAMPVPGADVIRQLGKCLLQAGDLSTRSCDRIISEVINGKN